MPLTLPQPCCLGLPTDIKNPFQPNLPGLLRVSSPLSSQSWPLRLLRVILDCSLPDLLGVSSGNLNLSPPCPPASESACGVVTWTLSHQFHLSPEGPKDCKNPSALCPLVLPRGNLESSPPSHLGITRHDLDCSLSSMLGLPRRVMDASLPGHAAFQRWLRLFPAKPPRACLDGDAPGLSASSCEPAASLSWCLTTSSGHMISSPHFLLPLEDSVLLKCHIPSWSQSVL